MERFLLGVFCLSGCCIFSSCLLYQYHYIGDYKNWTEAQAFCREGYADLATVETAEDMKRLVKMISSFGYNDKMWIGLYDNSRWRWSDGYKGNGADYKNWGHGKPSVNYLCVMTGPGGSPWWDGDCSSKYQSICYNGTSEEPGFVFVEKAMNWSNAQKNCREKFTDLATVRNSDEHEEIAALVPDGNHSWIGLSRSSGNQWSDGSSFRNIGEHSQPVSFTWCGVVSPADLGTFPFVSCETKLPFVCYSIPTCATKQVVKLKIQPQGSSMDPNDPALKADLLKKLQDALKKKGVSGVNLKWKEQPDGKVFHKDRDLRRKQNVKTEF